MVATSGIHPATNSLRYVLEAHGVTNPHTGKPFSEAMLLGIGGGVGAGYILWEFKAHNSATLVLAFRNRWHKNVEFLTQLCQHMGIKPEIKEASRKQAAVNLKNALADGKPVMTWVDKAHLPYYQLPISMSGFSSHIVATISMDEASATVVDLAQLPYTVPLDDFADARDRVVSDKNRIMTFTFPAKIDLSAAIKAGITNMLDHLSSDSESFSLPVLKKWAKLLTHPKDKKSWLVVFKECNGLYLTLRSIHEGIIYDETEGYGLRHLYVAFLKEAADVLQRDSLLAAAEHYEAAGQLWRSFAEAVLPDHIPRFAATKKLMQARYTAFCQNDTSGLSNAMEKLLKLESELNGAGFPLDTADTRLLFEEMQSKITAIYDAEVMAVVALKSAMPS